MIHKVIKEYVVSQWLCVCVCVATSGAGKLKSRFENMAKTAEEENRKRAEEERARRQARERREKEEAQKRQEVKTHTKYLKHSVYCISRCYPVRMFSFEHHISHL